MAALPPGLGVPALLPMLFTLIGENTPGGSPWIGYPLFCCIKIENSCCQECTTYLVTRKEGVDLRDARDHARAGELACLHSELLAVAVLHALVLHGREEVLCR